LNLKLSFVIDISALSICTTIPLTAYAIRRHAYNFIAQELEKKTAELDTLESHININTDSKIQNIVLKMDVEGAEYESLLATPDSILEKASQLVIEVHDIDQIDSDQDYGTKTSFFEKLTNIFHVYHGKHNNHTVTRTKFGYRIPSTVEITYVNKNLPLETIPRTAPFRHTLNIPNRPNRTNQCLDYWPFNGATVMLSKRHRLRNCSLNICIYCTKG
jgi:hypothetical protein